MLNVLARGCPSWAPVKGWQDLGGCWAPPASASWWTPPHIALAAACSLWVAVMLGAALWIVRDRMHYRQYLRGAR